MVDEKDTMMVDEKDTMMDHISVDDDKELDKDGGSYKKIAFNKEKLFKRLFNICKSFEPCAK